MDFTVAVLHGALASGVAITQDALMAANLLSQLHGGPALRWRVLGSAAHTRLSGGMGLDTTPLTPRLRLGKSVLLIHGVALSAPPGQRYDASTLDARMVQDDAQMLAALAAKHHRQGGTVAASCAGVFVVGHAGLLEGRTATTHWRLARDLQQRFRTCSVDAQRMVVEQDRVITAGASLAQMDLMLHLIRQTLGQQVADLTMKYLLLDDRSTQAPYAVWSHLHQSDTTTQALEAWVERNLPEVPPLPMLAQQLGMSEKTLARHVRKATGHTPQALVQAVRLRRARHLLDTTRLPLDEVAAQVGYADATALRKLTRKVMNTTPGRLRAMRGPPLRS
nr:helix-turn-helix domain-containing protein [uncultured Rhodoferax sp.]